MLSGKKSAIASAIILSVGIVLYLVSLLTAWECVDVTSDHDHLSTCSRLYGDWFIEGGAGAEYGDSADDTDSKKSAFVAVLVFFIIALITTTGSFVTLLLATCGKEEQTITMWQMLYLIMNSISTACALIAFVLYGMTATHDLTVLSVGFVLALLAHLVTLFPLLHSVSLATQGAALPKIASKYARKSYV